LTPGVYPETTHIDPQTVCDFSINHKIPIFKEIVNCPVEAVDCGITEFILGNGAGRYRFVSALQLVLRGGK
jgi:hypothetical protein